MLIQSGYSNVSPATVTLKATVDKAMELLPYDFKLICEAFLAHLGVDAVTDRDLPEWSANRMLMIELVRNAETHESPEQTFTFNFHILKARVADSLCENASATYALYTVSRLRRLLAANGNLDGHAGLLRIDSIEIITGSEWSSIFAPELGDQIDGATLTIQYTAATPESIRLY